MFPLKLPRAAFIVRLVVCLTVGYVLSLIYQRLLPGAVHPSMLKALVWLCTIPYTAYVIAWVVVPRLRDIGKSPWFGLLSLIPFVNFILFAYLMYASRVGDVEKESIAQSRHR